MLIDDNKNDNFFHGRVVKQCDAADVLVVKQSGKSALEYLQSQPSEDAPRPSLIFLDINMPGMSGWEFLDQYEKLGASSKSSRVVVLTTSENPDDQSRAVGMKVDLLTKPLTAEALERIMAKYPDL